MIIALCTILTTSTKEKKNASTTMKYEKYAANVCMPIRMPTCLTRYTAAVSLNIKL